REPSHMQFFTFTSARPAPVVHLFTAGPLDGAGWNAIVRDGLDFAVRSDPGVALFIGAIVRGDGTTSPAIEQVRVWYGRDTYVKFLPALYQRQGASTEFLERLLGLEQVELEGLEEE